MSFLTEFLGKLPDMFQKTPVSNLAKLFSIPLEQLEKLKTAFTRMEEWRDIDNAQGAVLDRIGQEILQEYRGGMTDAQYRLKLKTRIIINYLSNGDIESIIQLLNIFLNNNLVSVQTAANVKTGPFAGTPATVLITIRGHSNEYGIPFEELARVMVGGVSTEWEYLLDRVLTISQSYEVFHYPFEYFAGELIAGGEKQMNGNAAYTASVEIGRTYFRTDQPYQVASEDLYVGGTTINALYTAETNVINAYVLAWQDYPVCGEFVAGGDY